MMNSLKKIGTLAIVATLILAAFGGSSSCSVQYKFKDVTIPDSIKSVKVNFFDNKARYVNPQLSPRLTDRLRQKIVNQTRLTQTNNDNADWEISGYISEYNLSTSAISGQREAGNRLTIGVHVTVTGLKKDTPSDYDISRNFEFSANKSLQQAEQELAEEIFRNLTDDIFNQIFSGW